MVCFTRRRNVVMSPSSGALLSGLDWEFPLLRSTVFSCLSWRFSIIWTAASSKLNTSSSLVEFGAMKKRWRRAGSDFTWPESRPKTRPGISAEWLLGVAGRSKSSRSASLVSFYSSKIFFFSLIDKDCPNLCLQNEEKIHRNLFFLLCEQCSWGKM